MSSIIKLRCLGIKKPKSQKQFITGSIYDVINISWKNKFNGIVTLNSEKNIKTIRFDMTKQKNIHIQGCVFKLMLTPVLAST